MSFDYELHYGYEDEVDELAATVDELVAFLRAEIMTMVLLEANPSVVSAMIDPIIRAITDTEGIAHTRALNRHCGAGEATSSVDWLLSTQQRPRVRSRLDVGPLRVTHSHTPPSDSPHGRRRTQPRRVRAARWRRTAASVGTVSYILRTPLRKLEGN